MKLTISYFQLSTPGCGTWQTMWSPRPRTAPSSSPPTSSSRQTRREVISSRTHFPKLLFSFLCFRVFAAGFCAEDHRDVKGVTCRPDPTNCVSVIPPKSSSSSPVSNASLSGDGDIATVAAAASKCLSLNSVCREGAMLFKAHGPLTGYCVQSDRQVFYRRSCLEINYTNKQGRRDRNQTHTMIMIKLVMVQWIGG